MNIIKNKNIITPVLAVMLLLGVVVGCERSVDNLEEPGFTEEPRVFTDTFVGMGENFYFPFETARPDVFSVDEEVGFESNSSIRIDVPNANDPLGNFAGAIFRVDGSPRDLTNYNALTFYAKASQGAIISDVGFGTDFEGDTYQASRSNVSVGTTWSKYVVPIPDADKLTQERGLFWFAAGTQETDGFGYTIWFDEIKFERLGTIANQRPGILEGSLIEINAFTGQRFNINGLKDTLNYAGGPVAQDIVLNVAPSYFDFDSSDPNVATVNQFGEVSVATDGNASITATLNNVEAVGSLVVESIGELPESIDPLDPPEDEPTYPDLVPENVKSIFSDSFESVTESNFSPGFGGSTTETSIINLDSGSYLSYTNNNYTGIVFNNLIDGTEMTHLHVDVFVLDSNVTAVDLQLRDAGENQIIETDQFSGQPIGDDVDLRTTLSGLQAGEWVEFDIPLTGDLSNQKDNLGQIVLVGGPDFLLDNIFLYKE